MLTHTLYRLYLKVFFDQKEPFYFLSFVTRSHTKYVMQCFFIVICAFYLTLANAEENTADTTTTSDLSTALIFIEKADDYYEKKRYKEAIEQYINALTYLSDYEKFTQKKLAETYKKIAQSYKRLRNREQTASFYKKALDTFTIIDDQKNMARTLNTLAEAERYLGHYQTALDYSIQGLKLHDNLNDSEGHAKALMGAGIIYRLIGRYEKSLEYIYRAHQIYEKINNVSGIAKTSNQMGLLYTKIRNYQQAKSFYQQTIDLPESEIDPETLAIAYRELAVIALDSEFYELAKKMAEKAYKIYLSEGNKEKSSLTSRIIANTYKAQHDIDNAIRYYRKSLSLATEMGSDIYQLKSQISLANTLIGKNTDEAISLLKKSLILSIKINTKSYELYAYNALRKAEKSQGNFAESLAYAEKEISLSREIQNENEKNQLVLAKANLHSRKIEIELESLKKISELEKTKNRYANITLVSLLTICFLVVIYIYRRFAASTKHNKELSHLATLDPLTNCYNRRGLFNFIDRDFSTLDQLDEYCIILADIDHFKIVNDTHGHSVGDRVLRDVATILQANVRKSDIVARFGGEEFCIILPTATKEQATQIAENIRKNIENSLFEDISITCSLGVTSIQFNAKSPTKLIDQADLALFKSKSLGRNKVTLWSQTLEK